MDEKNIKKIYFHWLCSLIGDNAYMYHFLLLHLHSVYFYSRIPMDENREIDGMNLRYRFACDQGYDYRMVATCLDFIPCSMLEMMLALACKCSQLITDNDDEVPTIFGYMLNSLQVSSMTNIYYDEQYVQKIINNFLNGNYCKDGTGGLFILKNCNDDVTKMELWIQAMQYLNDLY